LSETNFTANGTNQLKPRTKEQIEQAANSSATRQTQRTLEGDNRRATSRAVSTATKFCEKQGINYEAFICARRRQMGVLKPNVSIGRRVALIKRQPPANK
jgi:hypothetical protein